MTKCIVKKYGDHDCITPTVWASFGCVQLYIDPVTVSMLTIM